MWYRNKSTKKEILHRKIELNGKILEYVLTRKSNTQHIRITIGRNPYLKVHAPYRVTVQGIETFIISKSDWIISKIDYIHSLPLPLLSKTSTTTYLENKEKARILVQSKIKELNTFYNFKYGKVSIKNQKTLWGSCSRKGNLNFNYKLAIIPEELARYVVAHELCHLKEFNHSKRFWDLVSTTIPNHTDLRKKLKVHGLSLG